MDVFGHVSEISLVFDFMKTDLEVIIKDTNVQLSPAHVKSYIIMTLKGLEYLHNKWILHRVSQCLLAIVSEMCSDTFSFARRI